MIINILTDDPNSWFIEYGKILQKELIKKGHGVNYVFNKKELFAADICFILSCTRIIDNKYLSLNKHNIVVHASDLPKGKGFSPMQWQIYEGNNSIPLTLFEVVESVDAGPYYIKDIIALKGTELYDELRKLLGNKIIEMCLYFVDNLNILRPIMQEGEESFYPRRTVNDDKVSIDSTLKDLFNHFRIADNENHPIFFEYLGEYFNVRVTKRDKK